MSDYRMKDQVVEAKKFYKTDVMALLDWIEVWQGQAWLARTRPEEGENELVIVITTDKEEKMMARVGDWIIRRGTEFVPCRDDVFWDTYEEANVEDAIRA